MQLQIHRNVVARIGTSVEMLRSSFTPPGGPTFLLQISYTGTHLLAHPRPLSHHLMPSLAYFSTYSEPKYPRFHTLDLEFVFQGDCESDARFIFCAAACCHMINRWSGSECPLLSAMNLQNPIAEMTCRSQVWHRLLTTLPQTPGPETLDPSTCLGTHADAALIKTSPGT